MRIDAFAHVLPPRYREKVLGVLRGRGDHVASEYERMLGNDPTLTDLDARFRLMDEIGADYRQVLVMGHTSAEHEAPDVAAGLAATGNEELAGLVAAHPDRFAGWVAQTALQDGERGLTALEQAITEGAVGAQVFTSMQGRCLDHPDYEPFFALMARLDRPVWIHPNRTTQWSDFPLTEPESRYHLYSRAGWPTDTTVTMCRLAYAGYLERWPDLKIVVHHSGGTVPMLAGRLKAPPAPAGDGAQAAPQLPQPTLVYLKRFYADTANFGNPIALRAALEFFGTEHVLFGTDFGFSPRFAPETVDDVEAVITDAAQKQAIYEGNARRVLRLQEAGVS
ncbi:MAG: amidohydrolase [Candidatus Dormibacteraeota bacterium]|nr:amidohydrolase [Candidatus Dormibacteraeota bacterium]MBO0704251.1 amidohydrolase [Candidatus Dormibacteraeota bacterium]MBO0761422.1 amidohydrolase [Candidatus Dormibacteraeota bacterium]